MKLDILAIGAHPDDIELCCSGTIARAAEEGRATGILDLTRGELGTRGSRATRAKEARAAAAILGVRARENLGLRDGNIEVNRTNRLKLVQAIRHYRPEILLIPYSRERHPDHVHAHQLCREAAFYAGLRRLLTKRGGRAQEPWRPRSVFQFMQWHEFTPSFLVDISSVYDKRMKSILAYGSQFYNPRSKDPETFLSQKPFLDFVESRARHYGGRIGVAFAEPFYSEEMLGLHSLFDLQMMKG